jgi:hypothetical protein
VMTRTRGREAELGDDRHFEGNWGLHFWDAGLQEIESRKYESTPVNLGPPGYFGATRLARGWVSRLLKTAVRPR